MRFNNFVLRDRKRVAFTVPAQSGSYASERITFGEPGATGTYGADYYGFTALIEQGGLSGAVLELWLPRVAGGDQAASERQDADYTNSGLTPLTVAGAVSWELHGGWVGAQLRVKSGGTQGIVNVSATAI